MKSSDKRILLVVLGLAAVAGLWFGLISPKRAELGKLDEEVANAQAAVSEQEELASAARAAQENYRAEYRSLIELGKAVPRDDDVASLIDQVDGVAGAAGIQFSGLKLVENTAAIPAPAETAPSEGEDEPEGSGGEAAPAPTSVPPTETAVAGLPLGATVGPAGLPIMPYDLAFEGDFFQVADFMAGLDGLVRTGADGLGVDGRLITVDGFNIAPDPDQGFPTLVASLHVTTFVTPPDQGVTAGADPSAPAPASATPATPTTATPAATAAVAAPAP